MKSLSGGKKRLKKGAIELSMTTIIIVVIGVTILTLGLRWVYSIFGGLDVAHKELERLTQNEITELFEGSDEAISVATSVISNIKRGETYNLRVVMRNKHSESHKFNYDIIVEGVPGNINPEIVKNKLTWYKQEIELSSGGGFVDYISINTEGLSIGQYRLRVALACSDCIPPVKEFQPIIFEISL